MNTLSILSPQGNTIRLTAAGDGPPLVLLHGFPHDHRLWLPQLESLSEQYHVLVPEQRGFGQSSLGEADYTLADVADDVEMLRKHLGHDQQITLCGLSMGGYVALEYWRRHGENLRGLILANTKPQADAPEAREARLQMADDARRRGGWAAVSPMLPKMLAAQSLASTRPASTRSGPLTVPQLLEQMMRDCTADAIIAAQRAMAERSDFVSQLPAIQVPTLVVTGENDPLAPPPATRKWAAVIPDSQCQVIPQAAHLTPLESPQAFNKHVQEFLSGLA